MWHILLLSELLESCKILNSRFSHIFSEGGKSSRSRGSVSDCSAVSGAESIPPSRGREGGSYYWSTYRAESIAPSRRGAGRGRGSYYYCQYTGPPTTTRAAAALTPRQPAQPGVTGYTSTDGYNTIARPTHNIPAEFSVVRTSLHVDLNVPLVDDTCTCAPFVVFCGLRNSPKQNVPHLHVSGRRVALRVTRVRVVVGRLLSPSTTHPPETKFFTGRGAGTISLWGGGQKC